MLPSLLSASFFKVLPLPQNLTTSTASASTSLVCTDRGEGVKAVRTFCGQEGRIFRDFVRTSFMDDPLLQNI